MNKLSDHHAAFAEKFVTDNPRHMQDFEHMQERPNIRFSQRLINSYELGVSAVLFHLLSGVGKKWERIIGRWVGKWVPTKQKAEAFTHICAIIGELRSNAEEWRTKYEELQSKATTVAADMQSRVRAIPIDLTGGRAIDGSIIDEIEEAIVSHTSIEGRGKLSIVGIPGAARLIASRIQARINEHKEVLKDKDEIIEKQTATIFELRARCFTTPARVGTSVSRRIEDAATEAYGHDKRSPRWYRFKKEIGKQWRTDIMLRDIEIADLKAKLNAPIRENLRERISNIYKKRYSAMGPSVNGLLSDIGIQWSFDLNRAAELFNDEKNKYDSTIVDLTVKLENCRAELTATQEERNILLIKVATTEPHGYCIAHHRPFWDACPVCEDTAGDDDDDEPEEEEVRHTRGKAFDMECQHGKSLLEDCVACAAAVFVDSYLPLSEEETADGVEKVLSTADEIAILKRDRDNALQDACGYQFQILGLKDSIAKADEEKERLLREIDRLSIFVATVKGATKNLNR